jgi:succinyl-CoA synthetase beta subunit
VARLHEYQGKALLRAAGIETPRGEMVRDLDDVERVATEIGGPVVVKIQAWTTGRKAIGGVAFADTPREAKEHARRMLGMKVGNFPVEMVLVEEKSPIARELFVSFYIDDAARGPALLLSAAGGSDIEERAGQVARIPCDVRMGPDMQAIRDWLAAAQIDPDACAAVERAVVDVYDVARTNEARSVEINPLAILEDGRVVAADCRMTIDDYAVFRHPDLGIEIARELDHPPTDLERVAYEVEQSDHRGTFYFAQLNTEVAPGSKGLVGFHGAGGGGSMMSMDAITSEGFTIANFCDTSGNPSAAKVYRAARIILSQPGLVGYFGSGSGVASQEQFWSAYGLAKAFWELRLDIPAVIRLGGNSEDRAVEILDEACRDLPGIVEGYKKDDSPKKIAARFAELVAKFREAGAKEWAVRRARVPDYVGSGTRIEIDGGVVWIDPACEAVARELVVDRSYGLLREANGKIVQAVEDEEFKGKDSELIACEVECRRAGHPALFVELELPGLE